MSKTGNFLWKLFCALVVFFYHRIDNARAIDVKTTVKLCSYPNQYVVSCNGYKVGFEWLKGATISGANIKGSTINTLTIPNYTAGTKFDDSTTTTTKDRIDALKYFFAQAGGKTDLAEGLPINTVEPKKVSDLLSLLCSNPSDVVCATCDGGFVDDSLYQYDETGIVADTWKFYTIADCYITDFTDQTGTYNYIETTSNPPIKHKFYYKPDTAAKQLDGTALPGQPK